MPKRQRLLLALALVTIGAGCQPSRRSGDPVILALGEQVLRKSDFEANVKILEARGGTVLAPDVREALLEPFLESRVLVLEARARGINGASGTAEEQDVAVQDLLASAVRPAEVGDEEVAAYYQEQTEEFRQPEAVTLRQILVPTLNEARDLRRRLQKDPKSFEKLARTRSRSPEAGDGGLMGTFPRGQLPAELEAAAFALPAGATSDIVETPLGFHVLRVDVRQPARILQLPECAERIRSHLARKSAERGVRKFVRALMARAKVNHEAAKAAPGRS